MWETWVQSLGLEDPLEKGMTPHSSILAWRIPGGHKELDMTEQHWLYDSLDVWSKLSGTGEPEPGIWHVANLSSQCL